MTTSINQHNQTTWSQPESGLPPTTRLGHVHLNVHDLERQIAFYTRVLGLTLHWRRAGEAALGTGSELLLRLSENRDARRNPASAGMYHFALLYPNRKELARAVARLFALRYPNAPTDHGVSQTTYLDDPEGNNIELYIRTLEGVSMTVEGGQPLVIHADGRRSDGRAPLDVADLFGELEETDRLDLPLPNGTQIGHVHLYVTGFDETERFYRDVLGFQPGFSVKQFRFGDVGLDEQQPHVIAFNTWKGEGIPLARPDQLGMRYFTIVLPNEAVLATVAERVKAAGYPLEELADGLLLHDPSAIGVVLTDRLLPLS